MFDKKDLLKWYDEEYCLKEVKREGYMLQYVKKQTEEMCLIAVHNWGPALRYVHNQTEVICMEAVKRNLDAIEFVDIIKFPRVWEYYQFSAL